MYFFFIQVSRNSTQMRKHCFNCGWGKLLYQHTDHFQYWYFISTEAVQNNISMQMLKQQIHPPVHVRPIATPSLFLLLLLVFDFSLLQRPKVHCFQLFSYLPVPRREKVSPSTGRACLANPTTRGGGWVGGWVGGPRHARPRVITAVGLTITCGGGL